MVKLNLIQLYIVYSHPYCCCQYGYYINRDKSNNYFTFWNYVIRNLIILQQADIILAGLTVTKARSEVVDFTYPFWEEPVGVVVRVTDHKETYFYKPLGTWVYIK